MLLIVLLLLLCCATSWSLWTVAGVGLPLGVSGTRDFVQYWSAWQLLRDGHNPYDGSLMHAVQLTVGQPHNVTTMMWNPPWVPVLLAPILCLPFEASALCWFMCNLVFVGAICLMLPRVLGHPHVSLWVYAAGACFLPFVDCMRWGQVSLVHVVGFVLFLEYVRRSRFFAAGLAISLVTVKPHIFILCLVPGAVWLVGLGVHNARRFLVGALGGLTVLVTVTLAMSPEVLSWWLQGLGDPSPNNGVDGVVPVRAWQTATVATIVRTVIGRVTGEVPDWPLWGFPAAGLVLASVYWGARWRQPVVWSESAPALVCCCLLFAGYGWLYDQSLLVLSHFAVLCAANHEPLVRRRWLALGGVVSIQLVMLLINQLTVSAQYYYAWVPCMLLALLVVCRSSSNRLIT